MELSEEQKIQKILANIKENNQQGMGYGFNIREIVIEGVSSYDLARILKHLKENGFIEVFLFNDNQNGIVRADNVKITSSGMKYIEAVETPKRNHDTLKIFISFNSIDQKKAHILEQILKSAGFTPIIIAKDVLPCVLLEKAVQDGIEASDCIAPILSEKSMLTQWVNQEIGFAKAAGKSLLPLVEEKIYKTLKGFIHDKMQLPFLFSENHESDSGTISFQNACKKLVAHLGNNLSTHSSQTGIFKTVQKSNQIKVWTPSHDVMMRNAISQYVQFAILPHLNLKLRISDLKNILNDSFIPTSSWPIGKIYNPINLIIKSNSIEYISEDKKLFEAWSFQDNGSFYFFRNFYDEVINATSENTVYIEPRIGMIKSIIIFIIQFCTTLKLPEETEITLFIKHFGIDGRKLDISTPLITRLFEDYIANKTEKDINYEITMNLTEMKTSKDKIIYEACDRLFSHFNLTDLPKEVIDRIPMI